MEGESNAGFLEERGRAHQGQDHCDVDRRDRLCCAGPARGLVARHRDDDRDNGHRVLLRHTERGQGRQ